MQAVLCIIKFTENLFIKPVTIIHAFRSANPANAGFHGNTLPETKTIKKPSGPGIFFCFDQDLILAAAIPFLR